MLEDVPARLIAAAMEILATDGPSHLKARTITARAGLTHSAVYNYFGGVPELLAEVVEEGYRVLAKQLAEVNETGDPVSDLFMMALVTHGFARQWPYLYDLMFGLSMRGTYRPMACTEDQRSGRSVAFQNAYGFYLKACERLHEAGRIRKGDARVTAAKLWCMVHGFNALELGAHFDEIKDPIIQLLQPMANDLLAGLGDDRKLSEGSAKKALRRFQKVK